MGVGPGVPGVRLFYSCVCTLENNIKGQHIAVLLPDFVLERENPSQRALLAQVFSFLFYAKSCRWSFQVG